jgi:hypothetical protein
MRSTLWITMIGLILGLGGCTLYVVNTEDLLSQAGFRKIPADTPQRAEHLQTVRAHRLIRRKTDGKAYYVYADPSHCKCLFVGSESAYAIYKTLVRQQDEAIVLQEERHEETVEADTP